MNYDQRRLLVFEIYCEMICYLVATTSLKMAAATLMSGLAMTCK